MTPSAWKAAHKRGSGNGPILIEDRNELAALVATGEWDLKPLYDQDAYGAVAAFVAAMNDDPNISQQLDQRICCSGHECGCLGFTVGDYLTLNAKDSQKHLDAYIDELTSGLQASVVQTWRDYEVLVARLKGTTR